MKHVGIWMIGIGLFVTVGLLTVELGYAKEEDDGPTRTLKTLKGRYMFAATGYTITTSGDAEPLAIVESLDFNGDGKVNVPGGDAQRERRRSSGRRGRGRELYCQRRLYGYDHVCDGYVHLDTFIAPNGKEFDLIQTDKNTVLAAVARKVSRK